MELELNELLRRCTSPTAYKLVISAPMDVATPESKITITRK